MIDLILAGGLGVLIDLAAGLAIWAGLALAWFLLCALMDFIDWAIQAGKHHETEGTA